MEGSKVGPADILESSKVGPTDILESSKVDSTDTFASVPAPTSTNAWIDEYKRALVGCERDALVAIANIAILDDKAAKEHCSGFGQVVIDNDSLLCVADIGDLGHGANLAESYLSVREDTLRSGADIAQEPVFVSLHGKIFGNMPWSGVYNDERGKVGMVATDDGGPGGAGSLSLAYEGALPEIKQRETAFAFEAYHAAVEARPDLAPAYAGILHNHLMAIHPFKDGNGRMARLVLVSELTRMGLLKASELPLGIVARTYGGWTYPSLTSPAGEGDFYRYEQFGNLAAHAFDTLQVLYFSYRVLCMNEEARRNTLPPDVLSTGC